MLMFDDISSEKRMMSTMSRYMDPVIASRLLDGKGTEMLGGLSTEATVMFTDIRGFTAITEEYGAQGTVSFLNEYFTPDGRVHRPRGRHARQVHRRRDHGLLRPADAA